MIMTLKEYKSKRMQDPEFAQEYAALQPEMNVIRAMIDARISQKLTRMVRVIPVSGCFRDWLMEWAWS